MTVWSADRDGGRTTTSAGTSVMSLRRTWRLLSPHFSLLSLRSRSRTGGGGGGAEAGDGVPTQGMVFLTPGRLFPKIT